MTRERAVLLGHLEVERKHVLAAMDGLDEANLTRAVAPSGWAIAQLLNHLTYDNEIFWGSAIICGDKDAIDLVQDGWKAPVTSGAAALEGYRHWSSRADTVLAGVDLDGPPRWWPSEQVFPFPPFADVRQCLLRLLLETAIHAGHLDMAREGIDGHQHLVVA